MMAKINKNIFGGVDIMTPMVNKYIRYLNEIEDAKDQLQDYYDVFEKRTGQLNTISLYKYYYFEKH